MAKINKMKPTLLVPILIDAMIVDENPNHQNRKYALNTNNYNQIIKFEKPNPDFLAQSSNTKKGVHLQWLLPESLTHGKEINGEIEFPKVPNRWLINRLYLDNKQEIILKSWLVLSDFLEENPTDKANFLLEKNGQFIPSKIGKVIDLADFQGDNINNELFLTAIGSGDAAFSVFTPENENIFSFIDEMHGLESEKLTIAYQVSGWYSNPSSNPLNIENTAVENIIKKLHEFKFSFSNVSEIENAADLTALRKAEKAFENWAKTKNIQADFNGLNLLCHGSLYHVLWNKKAVNSNSNQLPNLKSEVIIANSSFDGIVRLVQEKMILERDISLEETEQAAQLLAAFEHHLLDEIDDNGGLSKLEKKSHESWFTAENGGTIWEIKSTKNNQQLAADSNIINLLNRLNAVQVELDKQLNIKAEQQKSLYLSWIKSQQKPNNSALKIFYDKLLTIFEVLEVEISDVEVERQKLSNELNNLLNDNFELKQNTQPKFWEANEPVILVHAAKGLDKYAYNKILKCRYSGQTITNLKEHYSSQVIDFQTPTLPNQNLLPLEVQDLIKEMILVNPDFSAFLLKQINTSEKTDLESIEKQQTLIWNDEIHSNLESEELLKIAGFSGSRMALKAFSKHFSNQNFSPLFLDWQVEYYPNGDLNLSNWKLENYSFKLEKEKFDENKKLTLSGRTLLSNQTSVILSRKLKAYQVNLSDEIDKALLESVISIISELDIVSQQLSGFNEMLLGLDINDIIPVSDESLKSKIEGGQLGLPINTTETYPLRSGFLLPQIIQITDDFGQANAPHDERENKILKLLKAKGVDSKETKDYNITLLPPRLVQAARLKSEFIGKTTNKPLYLANEDSPILAWIMTDYLDKSLAVYDENGRNIGDLITFQRSEKGEARWLPNDATPFPNSTIENFVNGILNYENNGSALSAMMNTIDDSLVLNNLVNNSGADVFSLLFGQPLALMKVRFSLEIKGTTIDERLNKLEFPLRIGEQNLANNGVIGYFKNEDFSQFFTLNDKDLSDYIKATSTEKISLEQDLELLILMNPNGALHTISGILPTVELLLPQHFQKGLENLEMKFRVKPIMTAPTEIHLPKMGDNRNKMVWQQAKYKSTDDIQPMNTEADFGKGRNVIREGWLKP